MIGEILLIDLDDSRRETRVRLPGQQLAHVYRRLGASLRISCTAPSNVLGSGGTDRVASSTGGSFSRNNASTGQEQM